MPQQGRILEMKQGPHSLQPTRALHRTGIIRRRLLAWIGDQVRLKALNSQLRGLYIQEEAQPRAISGDNREEEQIEKGNNKTGDNSGLIIAGTIGKEEQWRAHKGQAETQGNKSMITT